MSTHSMVLVNGQGALTISGVQAIENINIGTINKKKIVVASVTNISPFSNSEDVSFGLYPASGSGAAAFGSSTYSAMTYFKTSVDSTYTLRIEKKRSSISRYTVNVIVADVIEDFTRCNAQGLPGALNCSFTYMVSNSPEDLNNGAACTADQDGHFLCRARIKGTSRIYYEHVNEYNLSMKFGVLLWNRGTTNLKIQLYNRSFAEGHRDEAGTPYLKDAVLNVWKTTFSGLIDSDESGMGYGEVDLLAGEKKWIALSTVRKGTDIVFNGVITLAIRYANGTSYTGSKVYCDTYIMNNDSSVPDMVKGLAGQMTIASGAGDNIRGSGDGAVLTSEFAAGKKIKKGEPLRMLITGKSVPKMQGNACIPIYVFRNADEDINNAIKLENAQNYAVLYRFVFDGLSPAEAGAKLTAKVAYNTKANPAWCESSDTGIYVAGYWDDCNGTYYNHFYKLLKEGESADIYTNIPSSKVALNIVVSGMSSLPPEICIEAK